VQPYISLIALILLLGGLTMALVALRFRTNEAPSFKSLAAFHPRHWVPVWRRQDWMLPTGYWLHLVGVILIVAGGVLYAIFR